MIRCFILITLLGKRKEIKTEENQTPVLFLHLMKQLQRPADGWFYTSAHIIWKCLWLFSEVKSICKKQF